MNYNVKDIERFVKNFNPEHFTEEDVEDFVYELSKKEDFNYAYGATKCVIIPNETDYVIKIPFDGYIDFDEDGHQDFYWFYNGGGEEGWDYCWLEKEYYNEIIEDSEFKDFFLIPEYVYTNITPWPIYIQKKAALCEDEKEGKVRYSSIDSLYKVRTESKVTRCNLPDTWRAVALENLNGDIEKLDRFLTFLQNNFSDLHHGNIGYIDNHAVIVDFGGFYENY